ncbi:hypothetical protein D3C79_900090 [compost metagenome]
MQIAQQRLLMAGQMRLPGPFGNVIVGHGLFVELCGEGLLVRGVAAQRGGQGIEYCVDVPDDLGVAGRRRLHAEQQAIAALDLTEGAEHRIAQIQLDSQPLIEGPLQLLGKEPASGLVFDRAKQQQRLLAGHRRQCLPAPHSFDSGG